MTEADWRNGRLRSEFFTMLRHVHPFWGVSRRTLFGVGCVRQIWEFLSDQRLRAFVDTAEGWATGRVTEAEFTAESRRIVEKRRHTSLPFPWVERAELAVQSLAQLSISGVAEYTTAALANHTVEHAAELAPLEDLIAELEGDLDRYLEKRERAKREEGRADSPGRRAAKRRLRRAGNELRELKWKRRLIRGRIATVALRTEYAALANLLRCVVGNPFATVTFDPNWRSETVIALTHGILAERAFDRLPILADALEEAGCDHPDILAHCRGPGPHALGCWVLEGVCS